MQQQLQPLLSTRLQRPLATGCRPRCVAAAAAAAHQQTSGSSSSSLPLQQQQQQPHTQQQQEHLQQQQLLLISGGMLARQHSRLPSLRSVACCAAASSEPGSSGSSSSSSRSSATAAAAEFAKFASPAYLDKAAQRFRLGLEQGLDEDTLLAVELGASKVEELSETQAEYAEKIKAKLAQRAAELAAEDAARRRRETEFLNAGKLAYERGQYDVSVTALEAAVEAGGRTSGIGGEALMWLALAYQACGREKECIDTYKWLEDNHPAPKVRKQAADLRFIMEAPKMELSPEERVTIPLLNSEEGWVKKGRKSPYTPRYNPAAQKPKTQKSGSYWDAVDWDAPLRFAVPDRWYVWVAWAVVAAGVAAYVWYPTSGGGAGGSA